MRKLLLGLFFGLLTQAALAQAPGSLPGCQYNATPPTLSDKQTTVWQCDSSGKLITSSTANPNTVIGPGATVTSGAAVVWDGTSGTLVKDSKIVLTVPAATATLTLGSGKTVTISNTLTFTGTDSSTLAIGTGGTLGTAAYQSTGTNGATIPFLNGTNIWANGQTFSAALTYGTSLLGPNGMTLDGTGLTLRTVGAGYIQWSSFTKITSPSDGIINFTDSSAASFTRLQLGGTTTAFPGIGRNGINIEIQLADGSTYSSLAARALFVRGAVPTLALAGGTCAGTVIAGGSTAGTVTLTGACAITNTMALTAMPTAPTGYVCDAIDRSLGSSLLTETATTTTSVTFTFGGTTGATDVLGYKCIAY